MDMKEFEEKESKGDELKHQHAKERDSPTSSIDDVNLVEPNLKIWGMIRFIHDHPCWMIWIVMILALAMSGIAFGAFDFKMSPNGNFYPRNAEISQR